MSDISSTPTVPPGEAERGKAEHAYFPKAILSVSQAELESLELTVKQGLTDSEGTLPGDLQGHFLIIAPAGAVASASIPDTTVVLPSHDGWTPLFNGDGMIYRFDFEGSQARLTTRILKTPCYYADQATHQHEQFQKLRFKNVGFARLSINDAGVQLGARNQINTAFLPFKFSTDAQERLLVTWDTGRPYEVDPQTLALKHPLGWNREWHPVTPLPGPLPVFPQVMTSAHPCFDPHHDELFTVNVGKSVTTILWLSRSLIPKLQKLAAALKTSPLKRLTGWSSALLGGFQNLEKLINTFSRKNFVCLLRWNGHPQQDEEGSRSFDRWRVVRRGIWPIAIRQTLHQMGLTRDYIVLADTSFKFDLTEILPYVSNEIIEDLQIFLNSLLDYPQLPYTNLYIIRRADLKPDKKRVSARYVKIPLPMAHYLVDYDNPDGKITLHAGHICATDPSETIRSSDESVYEDPALHCSLSQLGGTVGGPMDISRLGCYVIDAERGRIVSSSYACDVDFTWATAFYAFRDETPTKQFQDLYWNSWGCWSDILSKHIFRLYENYGDRQVPIGTSDGSADKPTVLGLTQQGIPASLCRLHIERPGDRQPPQLEIQDHYQFPAEHLGTSAQFIPKAETEGSTAGYIVCVVIHSNYFLSQPADPNNSGANWSSNSEIWVFDAGNLANGPLCRLSHPQLNLGFTLHTTWLPPLAPEGTSPPTSDYSVREDYEELIDQQPEATRGVIRELFENYVYPHFD